MNKNTDKDYWEGEVLETEKVITSALEMQEIVEQKIENRPEEKTKVFREWKRETNKLIDEYNNSFGKVYNHVK